MDSGERGVGVRFGVQIIWATVGEPWTYLHGGWLTKATVWKAKSGVQCPHCLGLGAGDQTTRSN